MSTKHAFFYIIFKLLIKHLSQPEFNLCCQWLYSFPEQNIYRERWPFLLPSFFICIDDEPAGCKKKQIENYTYVIKKNIFKDQTLWQFLQYLQILNL